MGKAIAAALVWGIFGTVLPTASADPVRFVSSGFYDVTFDDPGTWELSGDGFAVVGEGIGSVLPFWDCGLCAPGTPISLDATLLPGDFYWGQATVDGTSYGDLFWTGRFDFDSGSVAAGAGVRGSLPFTFLGNLTAFTNPEHSGAPLVSLSLAGSGIATLTFYPELTDGGAEVLNVRYEFTDAATVPEPATMLLLGSGLAGLAASRRRRRD